MLLLAAELWRIFFEGSGAGNAFFKDERIRTGSLCGKFLMQRVALTENISSLGLREIPFDLRDFGGSSFRGRPLLAGSGKG